MNFDLITKQHNLIFDGIVNSTTPMFNEYEKATDCDICDGTGQIPVMSRVYQNEPHMADLGETEPCICQMNEPDPSDEYKDWQDNQY